MPRAAISRRRISSVSPPASPPTLHIMDLLDAQPEFTKSIWDYLDILVNDNRLAAGRQILAQYKPQFDMAERAYGVDRYVIAAIWGIESNYSTQIGDRSVLQSTATLACVGRRQPYFREEFPLGAGNPQSWRSAARRIARLLGRRIWADPVHADRIQALCGRCRWRRPPRCGRRCCRSDRLDRQQPQEGRLADRRNLGL